MKIEPARGFFGGVGLSVNLYIFNKKIKPLGKPSRKVEVYDGF